MTHHGAALRAETNDDTLVAKLATDWRTAELAPQDAALCAWAEQLTRSPETVGEGNVAALRAAGLDDRAILDACQIIAYFNFVNRMALGLGVELEPRWSGGEGSPPPTGTPQGR